MESEGLVADRSTDGALREVRVSPGGGPEAFLARSSGMSPPPGDTRKDADQRSNLTGAPALPEWADNGTEWADNGTEYMSSGTSIFDPVLCELIYRWFSPPAGRVLDPFAGGSVRGVVASLLGRAYKGVDLSEPQVLANYEQGNTLCVGDTLAGAPATAPEWYVGDSRGVTAEWPPAEAPFDLVMSCPPYFDLEVYTDSPADLSQAPDVDAFVDGLAAVLTACCARLADDRFVVLVMGEARDKKGSLYGLIPGTVEAARRAGLRYHNEAILVTMVGSLPLRVGKSFPTSRKLGRTHQTMLVFVKGDARAAATACGAVEVGALDEFAAGVDDAG